VARNTVGSFVADLAVGKVGQTDVVAVSGGITLGIQGTGIGTTAAVLVLGAIADDILVVATSVGQQIRTTLRVIPDGGTDTHEVEADRTYLRTLAGGRTVTTRCFEVVCRAGFTVATAAVTRAVAAISVGTVIGNAVRLLVTLTAVGNVSQANGVTVGPRVAQFIVVQSVGKTVTAALGRSLVKTTRAVDGEEEAAVISQHTQAARGIIIDWDAAANGVHAHRIDAVTLAGICVVASCCLSVFNRAIFIQRTASTFAFCATAEPTLALVGDTVGILDASITVGEVRNTGANGVERFSRAVARLVTLGVIIIGALIGAVSRRHHRLVLVFRTCNCVVAATTQGDFTVAATIIILAGGGARVIGTGRDNRMTLAGCSVVADLARIVFGGAGYRIAGAANAADIAAVAVVAVRGDALDAGFASFAIGLESREGGIHSVGSLFTIRTIDEEVVCTNVFKDLGELLGTTDFGAGVLADHGCSIAGACLLVLQRDNCIILRLNREDDSLGLIQRKGVDAVRSATTTTRATVSITCANRGSSDFLRTI